MLKTSMTMCRSSGSFLTIRQRAKPSSLGTRTSVMMMSGRIARARSNAARPSAAKSTLITRFVQEKGLQLPNVGVSFHDKNDGASFAIRACALEALCSFGHRRLIRPNGIVRSSHSGLDMASGVPNSSRQCSLGLRTQEPLWGYVPPPGFRDCSLSPRVPLFREALARCGLESLRSLVQSRARALRELRARTAGARLAGIDAAVPLVPVGFCWCPFLNC